MRFRRASQISAAAAISTPAMRAASCASPWPMPPAPSNAIRILSLAVPIGVPPQISTTRMATGSQGGGLDHRLARAHRVEEVGVVLEILRVAPRRKVTLFVRFGHRGRRDQMLGVALAVLCHDLRRRLFGEAARALARLSLLGRLAQTHTVADRHYALAAGEMEDAGFGPATNEIHA